MANIIAILNFKGGVGKTTAAINISAALARQKKNVLLVDLDGQCDSTFLLDYHVGDGETIYDALTDEELNKPLDVYAYADHFDFVAASTQLDRADRELSKLMLTEHRLKILLEPFSNIYDYIIIDCPPNNGTLTDNALTAANHVIIPVTGDDFAMKGISKIMARIDSIKKLLNKTLNFIGFLFTKHENTKKHKNAVRLLEKEYEGKIFSKKIRKCVKLAELPSEHKTIFDYAPDSNGAFDYQMVVREITDYFN